jgi:hypothetical protein
VAHEATIQYPSSTSLIPDAPTVENCGGVDLLAMQADASAGRGHELIVVEWIGELWQVSARM